MTRAFGENANISSPILAGIIAGPLIDRVDFSRLRFYVPESQARQSLCYAAVSRNGGYAAAARSGALRGALTDSTCGPLNAIGQSSCTFSATPSNGSQVFEIVVEKTAASNVSEFTFEFAQGSALPSGIEIAAIASSYEGFSAANWTSVRYCRPDAFQFRCRFAPNSSQTFMLRIAGQATIETISVR